MKDGYLTSLRFLGIATVVDFSPVLTTRHFACGISGQENALTFSRGSWVNPVVLRGRQTEGGSYLVVAITEFASGIWKPAVAGASFVVTPTG
jgi:hypothetical protein